MNVAFVAEQKLIGGRPGAEKADDQRRQQH
jgi:hypothetical protein